MDTRDRLAAAAAALFAEHGYSGTSIAAIADRLGLTKQALLHHFATKDALYAAVLNGLSSRLMADLLTAMEDGLPPEKQLDSFFGGFCAFTLEQPGQSRLILRELMDSRMQPRAAGGGFLSEFLETLVALVQATGRWQGTGAAQALAVICQLLGAVTLLAASQPTLTAAFGPGLVERARDGHAATVHQLVRAALA
ncbi:TetR/AcrR family transcriptional regulator [Roseobacteraceae bacterium NS-SX3]